jgi:hypothetical protein
MQYVAVGRLGRTPLTGFHTNFSGRYENIARIKGILFVRAPASAFNLCLTVSQILQIAGTREPSNRALSHGRGFFEDGGSYFAVSPAGRPNSN